jgi:ornithine lipid ester-linked acyl 2-hydroxylase
MAVRQGSILYRWIQYPGMLILKTFDTLSAVFTANKPVLTEVDYPELTILEKHLKSIQEEYLMVSQQARLSNVSDFYKVETSIGQDENWKGFPLMIFNNKFDENIAKCPTTFSVLAQLPGCTSAMFSVLHPGKHILPHKGLYKGVSRCLFTIYAPENGQSWIKVNGQKYPFETGKCILFDETFEHEVRNESDSNRVVLYLDIYRKLPFPLNILNKLVFTLLESSPFIRNIFRSYEQISPISFSKHLPLPPKLK